MEAAYIKLKDYLGSRGVEYCELRHASGASAQEYHDAVGCRWEEQGKCLLLKVKNDGVKTYYIYVLPANRQADLETLAKVLSIKEVKMASRDELLQVTGCDYGELPPLAGAFGVKLIMAKDFLNEDELYMNAGKSDISFVVKVSDLQKLENPILC